MAASINANTPKASRRLLSVEPTHIKFCLAKTGLCKSNTEFRNTCGQRIAWRVRCTAPTRYIVSPASGFLTADEKILVTIQLNDTQSFLPSQKFVVQSMIPKDTEKDRRKVWDNEVKFEETECIRLFPTATLLQVPNVCSPVKANSVSLPDSNLESSSIAAKLVEEAKQLTEKKKSEAAHLLSVIAVIRRMEEDFDQLGSKCRDLNGKILAITTELKELTERYQELKKAVDQNQL